MVSTQIIRRGVRHTQVLEAMRTTERHLFVPSELIGSAYQDHPLPIGFGQTISQPYIVAFMSELLQPDPDANVLEVGTGCGYQTAILAKLFHHVTSLEIHPDLAQSASEHLNQLDLQNVQLICANGYEGYPDNAPYDRIIVTAAPETVPERLRNDLAVNGRMILPVGDRSQVLRKIVREDTNVFTSEDVLSVRFVPMHSPVW